MLRITNFRRMCKALACAPAYRQDAHANALQHPTIKLLRPSPIG